MIIKEVYKMTSLLNLEDFLEDFYNPDLKRGSQAARHVE